MRIALLVKQVPAVDTVKIDEKTGTMIRDGAPAELNPLDLHAVEAALRIKESRNDVEITVISMGPPDAARAVRYAIAMGADRGFLLSDRKFGGADSLATSRTLSAAIKKMGCFDLIFTGERATDGETGQVGPATGVLVGASVLSYVSSIDELTDTNITVTRAVEGGYETVKAALPAMVIPIKEMNIPRLCTLSGWIHAKEAVVPVVSAADLSLADDLVGIKGSATQVVNVIYPKITREGRKVIATTGKLNNAIDDIIKVFQEGAQ